jgi:hypothetical protein
VARILVYRDEALSGQGYEEDPLSADELRSRLHIARNAFNEAARLAEEPPPIREAVFQHHLAIRTVLQLNTIMRDTDARVAFVEEVVRENAERHRQGRAPLRGLDIRAWAQAKILDAHAPAESSVETKRDLRSQKALHRLLESRLQQRYVGKLFLRRFQPRDELLCMAAMLDVLDLAPRARDKMLELGVEPEALDTLLALSSSTFATHLQRALDAWSEALAGAE